MEIKGQLNTEIDRLEKVVSKFAHCMKRRLREKAIAGYTGRDGEHPLEDLCDQIALDATDIGLADANGAMVDKSGNGTCAVDIANRAMFIWWREEERRERAFAEHFRKISDARAAILAREEGRRPAEGVLKCPVCHDGLLSYQIAENGHINARCTLEGCVSWME